MPQIFPVAFEGQSSDEFGRQAARIGTLTLALDNAREKEEIEIGGNFLWAITATSNGKLLDVQFQDYTSAELPYGQGQFIAGVPYSRLYVTNTAQPGESITFLYGVEGSDGIRIDNPLQDAGNVNVADPGTTNSFASPAHITLNSGVSTLIAGADPNQRELIVQAHPDNSENITIGDAGVGVNEGLILVPGATLVLTTKGDVRAYAVSASQKVCIGRTVV